MTPLLGGIGAALAWASATLFAASSSRRIGGVSTLAWVMVSGFIVAAPIAAATGWPEGLDGPAAGWLALAGAGNVGGLALLYAGMRTGQIGVLASIASTEGAIAALFAIADGERPATLTMIGFVPLVAGVVMVALGPEASLRTTVPGRRGAIAFAVGAATFFGLSLFAAGQASASVPIGWVALPARVVGVAVLVGALVAGARPLVAPRLGRLAFVAGIFEVLGILSFAWGAREGIAITSVVSSQFAALTALGAFLVFSERLVRRQVVGVGIVAIGVALVALGGA
ncbi:MAG: EamA family transporter [Thermoleophilia bacterium]|nr:EamA family transporter [Thermoleophilia bacterium]